MGARRTSIVRLGNLHEKGLTLKKLYGNIEDVQCTFAEVAELADALRSGRSVHKTWGFKSPLRHRCCHLAVSGEEGSHRGLVRRFAKPLRVNALRGFESLPFRPA